MTNPTTAKLEQLIVALDLDALPSEEKDELLADVNETIFKKSLVLMIERMDEPTRAEFARLMESEASEAELEEFLATKVPGADEAIQEAVEILTDDILTVSNID